jgi:hydroxymethylpyrimidine/phosphomethylpyrimidine kinase
MDVAGIKGRIIKVGKFSKSASGVEFGASRHVGSSVLAYMSHDRSVRSAINIKYNRNIISICQSHFEVSFYDRFNEEPKNVKNAEGQSIGWGINSALSRNPRAEIIYHTGDMGKEPMTIIFGKNPSDVLLKVNKILKTY